MTALIGPRHATKGIVIHASGNGNMIYAESRLLRRGEWIEAGQWAGRSFASAMPSISSTVLN